MTQVSWGKEFVDDWIQPLGTIFVKLLKLIAIPLILASLVKGISDLKDISKFRNIGLRTIATYIITTVVAITIGLLLVNVMNPGSGISEETVTKLTDTYASDAGLPLNWKKLRVRKTVDLSISRGYGAGQCFGSYDGQCFDASGYFLYYFSRDFHVIDWRKKAKPLKDFFDTLNEVVLKWLTSLC